MVSDILWTAGGAELIRDRTRWGLHAMHYAAGNLGQGCPVLNEMIKLSSHQVVQSHLLVHLSAR